ncbi:hypothetical protein ACOMHN_025774 [Nucella lapillus]
MREKMNDMRCRLKEFRVELQGLRRMEQLNQETMRDAFSEARYRIKTLTGPPGGLGDAQGAVQMLTCSPQAQAYLQDKAKVETELRGCEVRMDALKEDMLTRGSPISASDIEGQALHLTHITKALAGLKARCPPVQESLKSGSSGEAQDGHQQFLSEESSYIEAALKRCKTLTTNLVTLKRIVTAQDTSSSSPAPSLTAEVKSEDEEDTMAILEHLRAMMPDCQARLLSQEAVHSQAGRSEADSRRPSGSAEVTDSVKCEPPQVPAKPARLLTASEIKQMSAATGTVATAASHTVTVTSQIADHNNDSASPTDRQSARLAFFSSMQSPPTSPPSVSDRSSRRLPTASRASAVSSSSSSTSTSSSVSPSVTSPSHSKSGSGIYYQAVSPTKSRSAFSSIPLPSRPDKEDYSSKSSDKGKKVPPPPPPRTSSARLSFSSLPSPNANGGIAGRRNSGDKSPDPRGKRDSALAVYKATSPTSPGSRSGVGGQKMNKFQKDIAAGIYANLNRPDLQHQNLVPDRLISNIACPAPAALVTNSQDPQLEEGELSGSESTGSSTSLDSQQGLGLKRANSAASSRGPKPSPPQRHSSLSGRGSLSEESGGKTKTQMLQERVRKSQEAGARRASGDGGGGGSSSQVNGVDSARNGHKTAVLAATELCWLLQSWVAATELGGCYRAGWLLQSWVAATELCWLLQSCAGCYRAVLAATELCWLLQSWVAATELGGCYRAVLAATELGGCYRAGWLLQSWVAATELGGCYRAGWLLQSWVAATELCWLLQSWVAATELGGCYRAGWLLQSWVAATELGGCYRAGWLLQSWVAATELGGWVVREQSDVYFWCFTG